MYCTYSVTHFVTRALGEPFDGISMFEFRNVILPAFFTLISMLSVPIIINLGGYVDHHPSAMGYFLEL